MTKTKTQLKFYKYDDVKDDLKKHFNDFMKAPENYGVEDPELIKEMKEAKGLCKHYMWKKFKASVKMQVDEMAITEAASVFILDFEQDNEHQLLTISQLEKIIDDPANEEYDLEPEIVAYLQDPDFKKWDFINHVIAIDIDLEGEVSKDPEEYEGNGRKILDFLKLVWDKISPFVDKILSFFVDLGSNALKDVIEEHVPEAVEDIAPIIDSVGDAVKEVDTIVDAAVAADNNGEDVKEAALQAAQNIGQELLEDIKEVGSAASEIGVEEALEDHAEQEEIMEALGGENSSEIIVEL